MRQGDAFIRYLDGVENRICKVELLQGVKAVCWLEGRSQNIVLSFNGMNGGKEQAAVRTDDYFQKLESVGKAESDQTLVGGHGGSTQPSCSVFQDEGSLSSWWQ